MKHGYRTVGSAFLHAHQDCHKLELKVRALSAEPQKQSLSQCHRHMSLTGCESGLDARVSDTTDVGVPPSWTLLDFSAEAHATGERMDGGQGRGWCFELLLMILHVCFVHEEGMTLTLECQGQWKQNIIAQWPSMP